MVARIGMTVLGTASSQLRLVTFRPMTDSRLSRHAAAGLQMSRDSCLRAPRNCPHYCRVRTRQSAVLGLLLTALTAVGCATRTTAASTPTAGVVSSAPVRPGLDQFIASPPAWARGKRIGLITNVAGIDSRGRNNIDLLAADPRFRLT